MYLHVGYVWYDTTGQGQSSAQVGPARTRIMQASIAMDRTNIGTTWNEFEWIVFWRHRVAIWNWLGYKNIAAMWNELSCHFELHWLQFGLCLGKWIWCWTVIQFDWFESRMNWFSNCSNHVLIREYLVILFCCFYSAPISPTKAPCASAADTMPGSGISRTRACEQF